MRVNDNKSVKDGITRIETIGSFRRIFDGKKQFHPVSAVWDVDSVLSRAFPQQRYGLESVANPEATPPSSTLLNLVRNKKPAYWL